MQLLAYESKEVLSAEDTNSNQRYNFHHLYMVSTVIWELACHRHAWVLVLE